MAIWFFLLKSIAGSIVGSAFASWFEETRLGIWFFSKINRLMEWASKRYNLEMLKREQRFMKKYPTIEKRIKDLEEKVNDNR